jgi:hypothetical protein
LAVKVLCFDLPILRVFNTSAIDVLLGTQPGTIESSKFSPVMEVGDRGRRRILWCVVAKQVGYSMRVKSRHCILIVRTK